MGKWQFGRVDTQFDILKNITAGQWCGVLNVGLKRPGGLTPTCHMPSFPADLVVGLLNQVSAACQLRSGMERAQRVHDLEQLLNSDKKYAGVKADAAAHFITNLFCNRFYTQYYDYLNEYTEA